MHKVSKNRHGFALGKFMPLHTGHIYLLKAALESCERLTIMVCSLPDDPIPGELRREWVARMFPTATVIHLEDPSIPQEPSKHPDFWDIWWTTIKKMVPEKIDVVYASEDYGWRLSKGLGATFVPIDRDRAMVPVSGTAIRNNPYKNWQYLPSPVRAYYAKRIAVLGPESTGKSTLVSKLAKHFNTIGVEEYARPFFDAHVREGTRMEGEFLYDDLTHVARGQLAIEDSLAELSNRFLICDTDVLTTLTWSDYLFNKHEKWIEKEAMSRNYAMTFVLHPADNPHVQDGQRVMESLAVREAFFNQIISNLKRAGRSYEILRGGYTSRYHEAILRIEKLIPEET